MTSRIIVENDLAGCFEYLMCQQMAPGPALFLADYKSFVTNNQNIQNSPPNDSILGLEYCIHFWIFFFQKG